MSLFYRLRRSVALIICPEMGVDARLKAMRENGGFFDMDAAREYARKRRSVIVPIGTQNVVSGAKAAGDHDAAPLTIRLEELSAAPPARQRVVGDGLKDRLDLLLVTGCAYAVRGFAVGLALVKFIHERALFGAGERVANSVGLKVVDATLLLVKIQKGALHRYLLRLKPDQSIEQVRDQLLRRSGIDIRLLDQALDVLCSVRRTLGEAHKASARRKDRSHGL